MPSNDGSTIPEVSLDLTPLKNWHTFHLDASNDANASDDAPPQEDPLRSARIWIKQNGVSLMQEPKHLDVLLKWLLGLVLSSPPQSLQRDNNHNNETTPSNQAAPPPPTVGNVSPKVSLLNIEWTVVLLLDLRVRCNDDKLDLFLKRFAKVHAKSRNSQTKRKKRKRLDTTSAATAASTITPSEIFHEYLVDQLTKIAFLLPSQEPFGSYVCQKFLTKYLWKRVPQVVTSLLDYFEVENPYIPKATTTEEQVDTTRVKKKAKRSIEQVDKQQTRRPFLAVKRPNNRRVNHFHGMLTDVEKMLDTMEPATVAVGTNPKSKKPPKSLSEQKRNTITPNQGKEESILPRKHAESSEDVSTSSSFSVPKAPTVTSSKASATSMHSPVRTKHPVVVAETPMPRQSVSYAAETPMTIQRTATIGETPSSNATSRDIAVAETPIFEAHTPECSSSDRNHQHQEEGVVKPLKLFAALQPVSKKSAPPPLPQEEDAATTSNKKSSLRPASLAVAAARSFLRRKSM